MSYLRFIILLIFIVPISCIKHDDPCDGVKGSYTKIRLLDIAVGEYVDMWRYEFQEKPIKHIYLAAIKISILDTRRVQSIQRNISLFPTSLACTPAENPTQKLTSITIYSDSTFINQGDTLKAGTNLADMFRINSEFKEYETSEHYLQEIDNDNVRFGRVGHYFILSLKENINRLPSPILHINIAFDDGAVFNLKMDEFVTS